jgi:hypothetical protein
VIDVSAQTRCKGVKVILALDWRTRSIKCRRCRRGPSSPTGDCFDDVAPLGFILRTVEGVLDVLVVLGRLTGVCAKVD